MISRCIGKDLTKVLVAFFVIVSGVPYGLLALIMMRLRGKCAYLKKEVHKLYLPTEPYAFI